MSKIVKHYLVAFLKNGIQFVGILLFVIIVFTAFIGNMSAIVQYKSSVNQLKVVSQPGSFKTNALFRLHHVYNFNNFFQKGHGSDTVYKVDENYYNWDFVKKSLYNKTDQDKSMINLINFDAFEKNISFLEQKLPEEKSRSQINNLKVNYLRTIFSQFKDFIFSYRINPHDSGSFYFAYLNKELKQKQFTKFHKDLEKKFTIKGQDLLRGPTFDQYQKKEGIAGTYYQYLNNFSADFGAYLRNYLFNVYQPQQTGHKVGQFSSRGEIIIKKTELKNNHLVAHNYVFFANNNPVVRKNQPGTDNLYTKQGKFLNNLTLNPHFISIFVNPWTAQQYHLKVGRIFSLQNQYANFKIKIAGIANSLSTVTYGRKNNGLGEIKEKNKPVANPFNYFFVFYVAPEAMHILAQMYVASDDTAKPGQGYKLTYYSPQNNDQFVTNQCNRQISTNQFLQFLKSSGAYTSLPPVNSKIYPVTSYLDADVYKILRRLNVFVILFTTLFVALLVLGFIFINFVVKKEIAESSYFIGLLKALGYRRRSLSGIFAVKVYLIMLFGAISGLGFSFFLQPLSLKTFFTNLNFASQNFYTNPLFLTTFLVFIPLVMTVISFVINLYYLRKKPLVLLYRNSVSKPNLLVKFSNGFLPRNTPFLLKIQSAITLQHFLQFLIINFIFLMTMVMLMASFNTEALTKFGVNNLFYSFNPHLNYYGSFFLPSTSFYKKSDSLPSSGIYPVYPTKLNHFVLDHRYNNNFQYVGTQNGLPDDAKIKAFQTTHNKNLNVLWGSLVTNNALPFPNTDTLEITSFPGRHNDHQKVTINSSWVTDGQKEVLDRVQPGMKDIISQLTPQMQKILFYNVMVDDPHHQVMGKTNFGTLLFGTVPYQEPSDDDLVSGRLKLDTLTFLARANENDIHKFLLKQAFTTKPTAGHQGPYYLMTPTRVAGSATQVVSMLMTTGLHQTHLKIPLPKGFLNLAVNNYVGLDSAHVAVPVAQKPYADYPFVPASAKNNSSALQLSKNLLLTLLLNNNLNNTAVSFGYVSYNVANQTSGSLFFALPKNVFRMSKALPIIGFNHQDFKNYIRLRALGNASSIHHIENQLYPTRPVLYNGDLTTGKLPVVVTNYIAKNYHLHVGSTFPVHFCDVTNHMLSPLTPLHPINHQFSLPNEVSEAYITLQVAGVITKANLQARVFANQTTLNSLLVTSSGQTTVAPTGSNTFFSKAPYSKDKINIKFFTDGDHPGLPPFKTNFRDFAVAFHVSHETIDSTIDSTKDLSFNVLGRGQIGTGLGFYQAYPHNNPDVLRYVSADLANLPSKMLPISVINQIIHEQLAFFQQLLVVFQLLIFFNIVIIVIIIVNNLFASMERFILTIKALGYKRRQINFLVIGPYIISFIIFTMLAIVITYFVGHFVLNWIFVRYGLIFNNPVDLVSSGILFLIGGLMVTITWCFSGHQINKHPLISIVDE